MAYSQNNAPANGEANWRVFSPGDSKLKSNTRMAALYETLQLLINAIAEYNANNIIQLPQFTLSIDGDANAFSSSGAIPYRTIVDAQGAMTKKSVNYLAEFAEWTTPTTGELKDIDNPYDALIAQITQVNRLNDAIRAGGLINSAAGLTTLTDDNTTKEYQFTVGVQTVAVVEANGSVSNVIQEHGLIADMQHGLFV